MSNLDIFTNGVKALLNKHYPSDACVEEISSFLYRYVLDILRKSGDIEDEIKNNSPVCQMEALTFQKNVKDILLFSSQNIIVDAMSEAFNKVRYTAPLVKAGDSVPNSISFGTRAPVYKKVLYDPPAADFDMIEIDSIPKVKTSSISVNTSIAGGVGSGSFRGNFREADIGDPQLELDVVGSNDSWKDKEESFVTDASMFSGSYDNVPTMSVDLDY